VTSVGVRELKNRLSHYLARARDGEEIAVTDRGREIAVLRAPARSATLRGLEQLNAEGVLRWGGSRPTAPSRPVPGRGRPASELVLEDRR
jgi:antitoxin (DNA-binding transcriptional repressor) of toxin-antitoxin stability system